MFLQIEPKTNKQRNKQLKPKSIKSLYSLHTVWYALIYYLIKHPNLYSVHEEITIQNHHYTCLGGRVVAELFRPWCTEQC